MAVVSVLLADRQDAVDGQRSVGSGLGLGQVGRGAGNVGQLRQAARVVEVGGTPPAWVKSAVPVSWTATEMVLAAPVFLLVRARREPRCR